MTEVKPGKEYEVQVTPDNVNATGGSNPHYTHRLPAGKSRDEIRIRTH